ncbi:ATP synthase gamma chain [Striga asiatica]|uniref:ATP synthase gamma chain n=1 Tax=Striga asiatica TaxID=4170 RepID=A0A5A7PK19_STRAF|nr:ATP synthase gamma chain [Striga asiatica]
MEDDEKRTLSKNITLLRTATDLTGFPPIIRFAAKQRLQRKAVNTSTRVGFSFADEPSVAKSFSAFIAFGVKTNLLMTGFADRMGWTAGLLKLGLKSGVLRGGKRVAELKTGEIGWPRASDEAKATQHLMNESSPLDSKGTSLSKSRESMDLTMSEMFFPSALASMYKIPSSLHLTEAWPCILPAKG